VRARAGAPLAFRRALQHKDSVIVALV
jgi:hypothetical protein